MYCSAVYNGVAFQIHKFHMCFNVSRTLKNNKYPQNFTQNIITFGKVTCILTIKDKSYNDSLNLLFQTNTA